MASRGRKSDSDGRAVGTASDGARQSSELRDAWKQAVFNEDRVMVERATLFLIVNSILAGGYALTLSNGSADWMRLVLGGSGLFFTFWWWYTAELGRKGISLFWKKILEGEQYIPAEARLFTIVKAHRDRYCWFWRLKARIVLSYVLPLGWMAIWVVMVVKFKV